jgi:hypothetical protein
MPTAEPTPSPEKVRKLLGRAARLARDYYAETGRPLGITGEVAEFEAAALKQLTLAPPRQEGYDATREIEGVEQRVQIKGRWFPPPEPGKKPKAMGSQKLSRIRREHPWHVVMLVLLDEHFRPTAIYEADRASIEMQLDSTPSKAHKRGVLSVSEFMRVGRRVWSPSG